MRNNEEHDSLYFPAIIFPNNCGCSCYIFKWLFSEVVWKEGVSFCQVQIDCLSVSLNITLFLHCKKRWIESPISFSYNIRPLICLLCLGSFDFFRQKTVQPHFGQMFLEPLGPQHSAWAILNLLKKIRRFYLSKKIGWYFLTLYEFIIGLFPWRSFY